MAGASSQVIRYTKRSFGSFFNSASFLIVHCFNGSSFFEKAEAWMQRNSCDGYDEKFITLGSGVYDL